MMIFFLIFDAMNNHRSVKPARVIFIYYEPFPRDLFSHIVVWRGIVFELMGEVTIPLQTTL